MHVSSFIIQESAYSATPVIQKKNENTIEFIAVLQEADKPNRNGRIYYKSVLEQALQAPYVQERLRTNSFYGECGHPTDTSVQRQMTIDQRNIAFLIREFWWEGNLLKARVETANTSIGRDMKGLIEQGSRVAFSLRAQGNVHHDAQINATIVESPIQIATYDWVVNPSHDKAFLETICEETMCSMFGVKESRSLVLAESVKLYESGRIITLNEITQPVVHDYAKNFWKKVKPLAEAYVHDPKDKLVVAKKIATVQNDNVTKKVVLEDFLLKDIRHRILRLTEEGEAAAQPIATSTAPAKEHTPEVKQAEVHAGEQAAEEVKAPIIESEKVEDLNNANSDTINKEGEIEDPSKKEEQKAESEDVTIKENLGDAAAQPVATSDAPAKEHTPEVKQAEVHAGEQKAEEVKAPIIEAYKPFGPKDKTPVSKASPEQIEKLKGYAKEVGEKKPAPKSQSELVSSVSKDSGVKEPAVKKILGIKEELGDAAAQPVATSDSPAKEHTPDVKKDEVHTSQSAEEVKAPIIESRKLPEALKKNTFDDPKDADKVPEKLEKKALKEGDEIEVNPGEIGMDVPSEEKEETVEVSTDAEPELMVSDTSIKIEIPLAGREVAEVGQEEISALKEAFRSIRSIVSTKKINEEEAVEVSAGAEAEVKVEGDMLVIEIPVDAPKQEVTDEEGMKLAEAVSAVAFILRK